MAAGRTVVEEPFVVEIHPDQRGADQSAGSLLLLAADGGDLLPTVSGRADISVGRNRHEHSVPGLRIQSQRAGELELRTRLGTAWMALKGWPAPEVWTSVHPALALAKSLGRNDALLPILWGLTNHVLTEGRIADALPWVQEMLDVAKATGDDDLLIAGHGMAGACYCFAGELTMSNVPSAAMPKPAPTRPKCRP